jgi:hypothetical protein
LGEVDHSLAALYANYLEVQEKGRDALGWVDPRDAAIGLMLEFSSNLNLIEQHGFVTRARHSDTQADGAVRLGDLAAVARLPQVR